MCGVERLDQLVLIFIQKLSLIPTEVSYIDIFWYRRRRFYVYNA